MCADVSDDLVIIDIKNMNITLCLMNALVFLNRIYKSVDINISTKETVIVERMHIFHFT